MKFNQKYKNLPEAIACSLALFVFSFFIRSEFPLKLVSLGGLALAAYIISRNSLTLESLKKITGNPVISPGLILLCLSGLISGVLLAMYYRHYLGIVILPQSIHRFVIFAALIGAVEELVFRGFIQEQVTNINGPFAVLLSSLSHTCYKCCLFLSAFAAPGIDIPILALFTFLAGILFGAIRNYSGSIIPSLIAHSVFDIIVYAEFVKAPWWVW